MTPRIVQIKPSRNRPEQTSTLPRVVYIKTLRTSAGQTSTCHPGPSRYNLCEIVRHRPPHATPHRPDKSFTKSPGAALHTPPRIVQIKPLRTRPEQTSKRKPGVPEENLYEIAQSKPPHANPDHPYQNLHGIVRSKTQHATPHRPNKTFTEPSGANLDMLHRIVQMKPLRNRPEQTSTCQPGSSK